MQKKAWLKILLCIVFVLSAGVFYLCMTGSETGELLNREEQAAGDTQQAKDAGNSESANLSGENFLEENFPKENGDSAPEENKAEAQSLLYVHVCGSVQNPGVYRLPENSRVVEAIEAAGGFGADAAADYLNQAGLLRDGQKVYVPSLQEVEELKAGNGSAWLLDSGQDMEAGDANQGYSSLGNSSHGSSSQGNSSQGSSLVNINTATASQLMELSGIGQSKAEAIIAYREQNGRFEACEDLMKVPGIKEAAYLKICDKITTGN